VETGRFLTVLPGCTLKLPRKHPSLRALPVEFPNIRHQIAILTLKGRSLSALAQVFIERVRALVKPLSSSEATACQPWVKIDKPKVNITGRFWVNGDQNALLVEAGCRIE